MSFEQDYNAELYHHGVKGMKWGKRKAQPQRSLYARITGSDKYYNEMMGNFRKDAAKKRASNATSLVAPKKQKPVGPVAGGPKKQKPVGPVANAKKKTSTGKKKANTMLQKGVRATGKTVSIGSQMAIRMMQNQVAYQMAGNIMDTIYR